MPAGVSRFASAYDAAVIARRARHYNSQTDGAYLCNECDRIFVSPAGLRKHLRAHQRRRMANQTQTEGEEDVVIETNGHPYVC